MPVTYDDPVDRYNEDIHRKLEKKDQPTVEAWTTFQHTSGSDDPITVAVIDDEKGRRFFYHKIPSVFVPDADELLADGWIEITPKGGQDA